MSSKSLRQAIGAAVATAGLVTIGAVFAAGASYADAPTGGDCNGSFHGNPPGSLSIITVPPSGSQVPRAGDVDDGTGEFDSLTKADACVTIGGALDLALSDVEKPASNDGLFEHPFTVPVDTPSGTEVCVRVQVHGQPTGDQPASQKSNVACFTVAAAGGSTTTTTTTTTGPSTEVLGVQLQNPAVDPQVAGAELPRTGAGSRSLLLLAGWALLLGGLALAFGKAGGVSLAGGDV